MPTDQTAIVVSLTHILRDGRVLRHCRALQNAGYRVTAIGLAPGTGTIAAAPHPPAFAATHIMLPQLNWTPTRRLTSGTALALQRGAWSASQTLSLARALPGVHDLTTALDRALAAQTGAKPVIIANDWTALPAALAAQTRHGTAFHYDTHELAVEEHRHSWRWRLLFPPIIDAIERLALPRARSVTCVSPGIAQAMLCRYQMAHQPSVLMSIPDTTPLLPRPVSDQINILYHGIFTTNRGLANLITSSASWPDTMRLVLRGHANAPAVERSIRSRAATGIQTGRITLEPMVAQSEVIAAANSADLGVFLPDVRLRQNAMALPNKLFEYLFAGLAPIVPADTDMARVLRDLDAGLILDDASPAGLTAALSALTPTRIMAEKQRAHAAALALFNGARSRTIANILAEPAWHAQA
jgi:glycosyltransferase involved in cell wall biosynthesis